jgi:hypothetical protein
MLLLNVYALIIHIIKQTHVNLVCDFSPWNGIG